MAKAAKPVRKDLRPLMIAIDSVTKSLGKAQTDSLRAAIERLKKKKSEYADVCRFCHAVKDPRKSRAKG